MMVRLFQKIYRKRKRIKRRAISEVNLGKLFFVFCISLQFKGSIAENLVLEDSHSWLGGLEVCLELLIDLQ